MLQTWRLEPWHWPRLLSSCCWSSSSQPEAAAWLQAFLQHASSGQVRSGQVRSGQIRSGQVMSGQIRSGLDQYMQCRQTIIWKLSKVVLFCQQDSILTDFTLTLPPVRVVLFLLAECLFQIIKTHLKRDLNLEPSKCGPIGPSSWPTGGNYVWAKLPQSQVFYTKTLSLKMSFHLSPQLPVSFLKGTVAWEILMSFLPLCRYVHVYVGMDLIGNPWSSGSFHAAI